MQREKEGVLCQLFSLLLMLRLPVMPKGDAKKRRRDRTDNALLSVPYSRYNNNNNLHLHKHENELTSLEREQRHSEKAQLDIRVNPEGR